MKIVICGDIVGLMVANCVLQIRRHIAVKQNFQLVYIERIGNGAVWKFVINHVDNVKVSTLRALMTLHVNMCFCQRPLQNNP